MDASDIAELVFYSAPTAWSHPLIWGVTRSAMPEKMDIKTVNKAQAPTGSVTGSKGAYYGYIPANIQAFKAANMPLNGYVVYGLTLF